MAETLDNCKGLLEQVADELQKQTWFGEQWIVDVHFYPPAPASAESVTLHLSKRAWFNTDGQGIHFETHLSPKDLKSGKTQVMVHLLHTDCIPGTKIKRIKLTTPVVDTVYDTIAGWDGYKFRVGKYGTQPFTGNVQFDGDAVKVLTEHLGRMAVTITPAIDKSLAKLLGREAG